MLEKMLEDHPDGKYICEAMHDLATCTWNVEQVKNGCTSPEIEKIWNEVYFSLQACSTLIQVATQLEPVHFDEAEADDDDDDE